MDLVCGLRSLTVVFDPSATSLNAMMAAVTAVEVADNPGDQGRFVEIPAVYDGADLHDVAQRCALSVSEVIRRHTAVDYTVAIVGFSAGFGYLQGLDPVLDVARRSSPRVSVPAGAVAIAAGMTCVYPRSSPGGWNLLGRTDVAMWDEARDPPALLAPGDRVRFHAVRQA